METKKSKSLSQGFNKDDIEEEEEDEDEDAMDWEDGESATKWESGDMAETSVGEDEGVHWELGSGIEENESEDDEPQERMWLGDDGDIIVELPGMDGIEEEEKLALLGGQSKDLPDQVSAGDQKKSKGKGKEKPHRFSAEDRSKAMSLHTAHLAALVARCFIVNSWSRDAAVQAALLSCLPPDLFVQGQPAPQTVIGMTRLVEWFHNFLCVVDDDAAARGGGTDGQAGSRPHRLLRVINQRVGCTQEAVQLFVALCHSLGLEVRYVCCLDPLPPTPQYFRSGAQTRTTTVKLTSKGRGYGQAKAGKVLQGAVLRSAAWAEVLCEEREAIVSVKASTGSSPTSSLPPPPYKRQRIGVASSTSRVMAKHSESESFISVRDRGTRTSPGVRWIHIDPVQGEVDAADKVESWRFRKRQMPYVVGVDGGGCMTDVTRRYSSQWSKILSMRGRAMAHPKGWWARALGLWRVGAASGIKKNAGRNSKQGWEETYRKQQQFQDAREAEERELKLRVDNQPIPSTLSALQKHHLYCDGQSLGRYQGLRPGTKAIGLVKGHCVYRHSDVVELAGATQWKRRARQVLPSEEGRPAKVVKLKGEKNEGTGKLYGEWQTQPWVPEAAVDGKVPRNDHGNIEFFDYNPAFLPPGTAHLQGHHIGQVASKFGVDYASALVGFESKAGRSVPVLDGIIVCSEHIQVQQILEDARAILEQQSLERQAKAKGLKVLKRWTKLVKGLLLEARIYEEYGCNS